MDNLKKALIEYVNDTENFETNYRLGLIYESMGQTAAAIMFYMRAAERTEVKEFAYECLVRTSFCWERQGNRKHTVITFLRHAICVLPKRPEAYFLLSRLHERNKEYIEAYVLAQQALEVCDFNLPPLRTYVDYPGKWSLIFEKAVSSWWWGKKEESITLFKYLWDNYKTTMDEGHRGAIIGNLNFLGIKVEV